MRSLILPRSVQDNSDRSSSRRIRGSAFFPALLATTFMTALLSGCGGPEGSGGQGGMVVGGDGDGDNNVGDGDGDGDDTIHVGDGDGDDSSGDGDEADPCLGPMPPADCDLDYEPSGPGCGDGEINVEEEECDDGNGTPGDGCTGLCLIEPNYSCDEDGCTSTIVCGDGTTQPGEVCDDGNSDADDGCSADCLSIDNGYTCPAGGGECTEIDPCKTLSPPASCFPPPGSSPYCGDGLRNNNWEACDDGNAIPGDGCNGACAVEPNWNCSTGTCVFTIVCGDGTVGAGEVCDDGDTTSGNGCQSDCLSLTPGYSCPPTGGSCTVVDPCDSPAPPASCQNGGSGGAGNNPFCGDGTRNQPSEACDDGNTRPGDGCSGACKVEPNWDCNGGSCVSTITCGDGVRQGSEKCDDANSVSGDGCSDLCQTIDPYFSCPPAGGDCVSTVSCNDGRITGFEECEDGNRNSGDGCSSTCTIEIGNYCPSVGTSCLPIPFCGDGIQTAGEQCDDANAASPGCNSSCRIEPGYACPTPGAACVAINEQCGNGRIEGDEQCDDGNSSSGDGCSNSCGLETGFTCPSAGTVCVPSCGDGRVVGREVCDDGGIVAGDGCSPSCTFEPGFYCSSAVPTVCNADTCGNGNVGSSEACDDGNTVPGDGCAPDCTAEPDCSSYGAAGCSSVCGDGLIINEQCDDGNTQNGDGCSSSCQIEQGFSCEQPTGCNSYLGWDHDDDDDGADLVDTCVLRVPITYRDFNQSHAHFEPGNNSTGTPGLVMNLLDAQGKPDWSGISDGVITAGNQNLFDNWYRNSSASQTFVSELILWDRDRDANDASYAPDAADVTFVNRFGDEGEKFFGGASYTYCGNTGECPSTPDYDKLHCTCSNNWNGGPIERSAKPGCDESAPGFMGCFVDAGNANQWHSLSGGTYWDGNPAFFPIDGLVGGSPAGDYASADYPAAYGGGSAGGSHNFHFTSEVRRWFKYDNTRAYTLDFTGDDDVWVFLNGRLAVDLGGWHEVQDGTISIAAGGAMSISQRGTTTNTNVSSFNLVNGRVYEIVVFQAERKYTASSYRLTLGGFNTNPSTCFSTCGDGEVASDEECDDGENDGGYGECAPGCVFGALCGDGTVDAGEECDNGLNLSGWNDTTATACAPGCVKPTFCGDGELNSTHETCDDGPGNQVDAYNACSTLCTFGRYCGDGIRQSADSEECDDGVNDGTQGCGPDCKSTASCGNGQIDPGEQCDDGENDGGYGECAPGCVDGPYCGDGATNANYGETCDDGINDNTYGGCSEICTLGPFCGDALVDPSEDCDDGENDGGYGECKAGCNTGDYCGDGFVSGPEACDDGRNDGSISACQAGCVYGPYCGDGNIDTSREEVCDDGSNLGGYNKCGPECTPGPYCGDGIPQTAFGEKCDDGVNDGGYGECAANCLLGPFCGDGKLNGNETCDDAVNNGAYGRCAPGCSTGSYCGDGIKQAEEQCDDGTNDGEVSSCLAGCVLGPGCGDGVLQAGEECDLGPGNTTGYDSCLPNSCKWGPHCGDGVVQGTYEQCDDGTNPGGYGNCAQNCRFGPYCGDGVVTGSEICDDGVNDGGYGECAPACKLGPYCGDGKLDKPNESCDDGNRRNGDGCGATCRIEVIPK